ncbi:MAG: phage holin family protein [Cyanobacteria bacterium]|nr:phage holin family protein [Cyanobacteriota bacterium]
MGALIWLLQWPIRAAILLFVAWLPLGVEVENFGIGLLAAVVIGLLGSLLIFPLKALFALPWLITSLGGLVTPISWLFNWLITVILFGLAAWLIPGFRLRNGLITAVLGAVAYAVISTVVLRLIHLDVDFTRASALVSGLPLV